MKKQLALLGSTGSIGTQTLEVVDIYPDLFEVKILSAKSNVSDLIDQCLKYRPSLAIITDEDKYEQLRNALEGTGVETATGHKALINAMKRDDFSTLVSATVGYSGLEPTVEAIKRGKKIALANKETLVVAGELINRLIEGSESSIIPIDSEHSAIYQCLEGEDRSKVNRLLITASGGPFLNRSKEDLKNVTVKEALRHPKWKMGKKITIDSATLMNKAFEIIEAYWLFGIPSEKIEAVVHPQSIVHSMVEFTDGAIKAQLGTPDMRLPICYALSEAERRPSGGNFLSLKDFENLTFMAPDPERFPCLTLAYRALNDGGTTACIINAANEIAVDAFLKEKISFNDIYKTIDLTLNNMEVIKHPELSDYIETNAEARAKAQEKVRSLHF